MRKVFLCTLVLVSIYSQQAFAGLYQVDLNQPGGVPGTGGAQVIWPTGLVSFTVGFQSAFYQFVPGDVVDLGWVTIFPIETYDSRSGVTVSATSSLPSVAFDSSKPAFGGIIDRSEYKSCTILEPVCVIDPPVPTTVTQLLYTIPQGGDGIQVSWYGPYAYVAPIPEPSTWAMLLIGFAGVGYLACRPTTKQRPRERRSMHKLIFALTLGLCCSHNAGATTYQYFGQLFPSNTANLSIAQGPFHHYISLQRFPSKQIPRISAVISL
ncbi:hypothetical protein V1277_004735 [Bradyrhizobium sp. AZCC 1588]|uniref:PEP-CTERM sorting domain-containing protein n=1 Tax=unclassified Bradyrhizobium TaxID=2631580 RepID=UPI002FEEE2BE